MKLHLPKKLRSAFLSAALAVSAAAPSFAAITPWTISYDENCQYATVGGSDDERLDFSLDETWNNAWSIVFSVDAASLKNTDGTPKTLTLLGVRGSNILAEGITMAGGSLTLSVTNGHPQSVSVNEKFSSCENITFVVSRNGNGANNLSLRAYDSADLSAPLYELKGDKAQNWSSGTLQGVVFGGKGTYTAGTNVSFANDEDVDSYHMTKAGYTYGSHASFSDLVNYCYGSTRNDLTWSGTNGNWSSNSWTTTEGTSSQSFTNYDSVTFATPEATVTLDSTTSVMAATVSENTTFDLNNKTLAADGLTVGSGKKLTVKGGGKLAANTISGGIIDATASSVELRGNPTPSEPSITNATIKGSLTLVGNSRIALGGTVVLDSVVNNLTNGDSGYSLVGSGTVDLTFTGTSDLTNGGTNNFSRIGLNQNSSITIVSGAKLKTSTIFNSYTFTGDVNASLTVEQKGTLELAGYSDNPNTCVKSLVNHGTITSSAAIGSRKNITNTGTLTVSDLYIFNQESTTSSLGGAVNISGALWLGGTTKVAGIVTTGYIGLASGATAATTKLTGDSTGTLNINLASGRATANVALEGSFGINKTGNSTQNFSGNTSGYSGKLDVSGGTLNLAQMGESSSVTLITLSGGSTLGLYRGSTTTPSTTAETTVTFGEGGKLTVGEGGGTLNANVVLGAGSTLSMDAALNLGSSLTLNGTTLTGALLNQLLSGPGSVTLFSGVDELYIGDSTENRAGSDFTLTTEEVYAAFALSDEVAALFAPDSETNKPIISVDYVANGGHIMMTSNVPEPATATLSLLALAALAARRRRK